MIKSKNLNGAQAVTANRLGDGAVVFLAENGRWSPDVNASAVAQDAATAAALMAIANKAAADQVVVGPYLFEVSVEGTSSSFIQWYWIFWRVVKCPKPLS